MAGPYGKSGGVWSAANPYGRLAGAWQPIQKIFENVSGSWVQRWIRFTPVTHTYTAGSGTEVVPTSASQVVISVSGGGGGARAGW